jgi:hypothetical protein
LSIILDEKSYVEDLLRSPKLGRHPGETLGLVAKYYRSNGYKSREIESLLEEYMIKSDPDINITKRQSLVDRAVRSSSKYGLVSISGINITIAEVEKILCLQTQNLQRLMFSLLCVAKYCNAVNPKNNNWVNKTDKEVFGLAGIKCMIRRQSYMLNDLWELGYIGFSKVVDNININVNIVDDEGEVAMVITDYRNLGNQFMRYIGEPYIECSCCGAIVKRNSNVQKYCQDCAAEVNVKKQRDRDHIIKH